ncbi:anti-sigma regulatory factor [Geobacter sp. SVR]|uniref:anti-sigma regulatory factor n=1 Tax=Geobacter sp. SVR TaxID=2495594 RepID=UPI00143EFF84|nr:anti-sigma regulatory factor [Geobacter sp. SVR]BCS52011.1 serine/threonine-protein kinase RsbT [Geobacter sp. SVR]GCF87175.1 serine/threonine-protein kinase RsbT [Geobacter sp. SVR]
MKGKSDGTVGFSIQSDEDVILARQKVRSMAQELGFSLLDQTKLVTAVSELARNIVVHAGEGSIRVFRLEQAGRIGLTVRCEDHGPGIPDVGRAMREGFSTVGSLGLGLPGSRRLVDEFRIDSVPGKGTMVEVVKWL